VGAVGRVEYKVPCKRSGSGCETLARSGPSRGAASPRLHGVCPAANGPGDPRHDSASIKKLGFEYLVGYTGLAAIPARFALERQAWREAAALEPRGSQYPQAEAITYFARAIGSARGGDFNAADSEVSKLQELRAKLENASQSYWAGQVEIQMLAASAWIAEAKGQEDEALKFMRAAADLEDNSEKHIAMENRLYPMRELLGDLLMEQHRFATALTEYEAALLSAPNRLRGLYGAAKAAEETGNVEKATAYFGKLAELTKGADAPRPEIQEAKDFLAHQG